MMIRTSLSIALAAASLIATAALAPAAAGPVLDRVKAAGKIVIGYREGAAPFSFKGDPGPQGYVIDVCQAVADDLGLPVEWASVGADDPFAAVKDETVAATGAKRRR